MRFCFFFHLSLSLFALSLPFELSLTGFYTVCAVAVIRVLAQHALAEALEAARCGNVASQ